MSIREHPGRLSTKSAPNAWNGVTRPRASGSEMILEAISSALLDRGARPNTDATSEGHYRQFTS
jgi:hypothetical protein